MASQGALAQARNTGRARARGRPVEAPLALLDRDIVDAGLAPPHQAVFVELPLLVAVGAMPLPGIVVPFVLEAHGDAVLIEPPEILDQAIVVLLLPFAGEKFDDGITSLEELGTVTPAAVLGIGKRDLDRIARIPGVFRHARFLRSGFTGEGRQRRTRHDIYSWIGDPQRLYRSVQRVNIPQRFRAKWTPVRVKKTRPKERFTQVPGQPSSGAAAISGLAALFPHR